MLNAGVASRDDMQPDTFILFAEDNAEEAEVLRHACKQAGLHESSYLIVRDGLEAIRYLEKAAQEEARVPRPTHVLTDVQMPLFDGLRLLWWIRTHTQLKHLHVTVVTNNATEDVKLRASRLGSDAFFQKPSTLDELILLICETIGSSPPHLTSK